MQVIGSLCLVMQYLVSFLVLRPSPERERERESWLLKLTSFCHVHVSFRCLFITVPWVGLQFVMAAITYILINDSME